MALIFWRKREPPTNRKDSEVPVDEDNGLPVTLYWRNSDIEEANQVTATWPLPVLQAVRPIKVNSVISQQVSVSATVITQLAPANANRTSLLLTNLTGTFLVHLGDVAVSATTSRSMLTASAGSNVTIFARDAVYGLAPGGAQTVLVWEEMLA